MGGHIGMFSRGISSNHQARSLDIVSGMPHVIPGMSFAIERAGFFVADVADVSLVVDVPVGFAMVAMEHHVPRGLRVIVTTRNTCPEYVEDLWDCRPNALLAGQSLIRCLPEAVARIDGGDTYRLTPGCETHLTPSERQVLRLLARGRNNAAIARHLHVRSQTVANTLTQVYAALGVSGREAAILHYWGIYLTDQ